MGECVDSVVSSKREADVRCFQIPEGFAEFNGGVQLAASGYITVSLSYESPFSPTSLAKLTKREWQDMR